MREFTFGQYYPEDSVMHRLDARVKIVMTIAFMVGIFLVKNFFGFLAAGAFVVLAVIFSRVPFFKVLKSIKAILVLIVITFLINLLLHEDADAKIYCSFWFFKITDKSIEFAPAPEVSFDCANDPT